MLDRFGGWPLVTKSWKEEDWSWEKMLLKLHRFVGVGNNKNIFRKDIPDGLDDDNDDEHNIQRITNENDNNNDNESTLLEKYPEYMLEMALLLGADDSNQTRVEIDDAFQLGLALNELLTGTNFERKSSLKKNEERKLHAELNLLGWTEIFDRFKLKAAKSSLVNYGNHALDNLKNLKEKFKPRDFANYLLWRIVDFSTQFLYDDAQEKNLNLNRQTYGVLDKEQRWKLCTRMTEKYASLASGSMYIREFFPKESRAAAIKMAKMIIEDFKKTIDSSDWMDENTQKGALETVKNLTVQMGYDEKLLNIEEVEKYYGKPRFSTAFFIWVFSSTCIAPTELLDINTANKKIGPSMQIRRRAKPITMLRIIQFV